MHLRTVLSAFAILLATATVQAKGTVSCITEHATEITLSTAQLNGTAVFKKVEEPGYAQFYISDTPYDVKGLFNNGIRYEAEIVPVEGGPFSVYLTELKDSTTYYYVASVIVGGKEKFGKVETFFTPPKPTRLCLTGVASEVTGTSARLAGQAFPRADLGEITFGFIVSRDAAPSLENGMAVTSRELDDYNFFAATAKGLESGVRYYYKAFLQHHGIYRCGDVHSFTTPSFNASVRTLEATDLNPGWTILNGKVDISGKGADETPSCYFLCGTERVDAALAPDGTFSAVLDALHPGQTYQYRAFAELQGRRFAGESIEFSAPALPVATLAASEVCPFTATISGSADAFPGATYCFYCSDEDSTREALVSNGTRLSVDKSFSTGIIGLIPGSEYFYVACVTIDGRDFYGDVCSFTTDKWPEYVDMADGLEWRSWNLGASAPEAFGDYYAWGEVKTKDRYDWESYKWNTVNWSDSFTKYCFDSAYGNNAYSDSKVVLEKADDPAASLGKGWRMPTSEEMVNLVSSGDYVLTEIKVHGVKGVRILSRANNNWIFLPCAGFRNGPATLDVGHDAYYWSSSLSGDSVTKAVGLFNAYDRCLGFPIRAVRAVKQ